MAGNTVTDVEDLGSREAAAIGKGGPVLVLLCAAQFMVILDATIVHVALSSMQRNLGLSPSNLQWVVNAYSLALGGFMLLGGRAADLLGRRRVFVAGLILFSLSSLAGGLAPSGGILIVARGLQGLGAALISPAALSILATTFVEGDGRNRAMAAWGATAAAGSASGALLGGVLTGLLGWRWVLFVNVPIGLATAFASVRVLEDSRPARDGRPLRFDFGGAISVTAGLVLLVYAVVGGQSSGGPYALASGPLLAALALLATFVVIERRSAEPLVRFGILRDRNLAGANLVALVHATGPMCTLYFVALFLQQSLGYSPLATGLALLPFALMAAVSAIFTEPLIRRLGVTTILVLGMLAMAASLMLFSRLTPASGYLSDVLPGAILAGMGVTMAGIPMTIAAVAGVSERDSGLASGLVNTSQQVGAAVVLAALVVVSGVRSLEAGVGYVIAFRAGAGLLLCGAIIAMVLIRIGHPRA